MTETATQLYTPEEVAAKLQVGRTTLYRMLREGVIPSVHIGALRRIRATDLQVYLDSLTADS